MASTSARHPELKRPRASQVPAVLPAAAAGSDSSFLLPLALGFVLGLSLLIIALALTPPWALPRQVQVLVYDRREVMIFGGFAIALSIGLSITLAVS